MIELGGAAESALRLGAFGGVLAVMAAWEALAPRRARSVSRWVRWPHNLGISALNTVLLRLVFPVGAATWAASCEARGWGLLNGVALGPVATLALSVVLLDLAIYAQHVAVHHVPPLWRLHRMHHADPDLDVTSGARFHPAEILLSFAIKLGAIAALGPSPAGVLAFEVILNATSMFNHANVRLPAALDRALRWVLVTPDMHRVHHSVVRDETDSNFGFSLPWWDRLFGTYRAQPRAGQLGMTIGIGRFAGARDQRLDQLLLQPLRREETARPASG